MRLVSTPDLKAQVLTFKGFVAYASKRPVEARNYCREGLKTFDSPDLETRFPELHWLHSLVSLDLGDVRTAEAEISAVR